MKKKENNITKNPDLAEMKKESIEKTEGDYKKDFELGVAEAQVDEQKMQELIAFEGEYQLDDGEGLKYKEKAFKQMIAKYGADRWEDFLNFLEKDCPIAKGRERNAIIKDYAKTLPQLKSGKENLNKKLYNMADYLEEGNLETLMELFVTLRKEEYKKILDFGVSVEKIKELAQDDVERKAFLDYDKKVGIAEKRVLQENIREEDLKNMSFKEKMKMYDSLVELGKIERK